MITENATKEQLSFSYIEAVVAQAGFNIDKPTRDYGIDGWISAVDTINGKHIQTDVRLAYQAKATVNFKRNEKDISYRLEVDAFERLVYFRKSNPQNPALLILMCLPQHRNDWLVIDEDIFYLRHCCYWHIIDQDTTHYKSKLPISIPRNQLFDVNSISALMDSTRKGVL